eukprot:8971189-Pyramimonas_sp.AAC.1
MAEAGCRPIAAQEKRLMVQNYAHVQQFCHPGSKGNRFSGNEAVHRCEAAQYRGMHSRSASQPALARCFAACASSVLASRRIGAISCNISGR